LLLAGALLAGCFDPRPPVFDDLPDAPRELDGPPVDPFAHVQLAPGYQVSVFQDFSAGFVFDANDWQEATEVHDNQPDYLFTLDTPFPRAIGVIAGREILVLDGTSLEIHDFGQHDRNTLGQADNLTGAVLVPDFAPGAAALVVSSGSEDTGDGLFAISPSWEISLDLTVNNTRCVVYDPTGAFDAMGSAQRYLGHQNGLVRRGDQAMITFGDTRSMRLAGDTLYVTQANAQQTEDLVRVATTTHARQVLATRTKLRLVEGTPPGNTIAWAIADDAQLVLIGQNGGIEVVAELSDPGYRWTGAVAPPAGHPLAGRVYVLESHRGNDLDRVLALTPP
jgi:hypothetical protein